MSRLVERRRAGERVYEVRKRGSVLALYKDRVLHTQYDPARPLGGDIWDLLALPGLLTAPRRALVLGVGGGAVVRALLHYTSPLRIDAVDLDALCLSLARAHFGLDDPRVHLRHEDARAFVARSRARYDFVLDDVFYEEAGWPRRAIAYDAAWANAITARLSPRGVLVVNTVGRRDVRGSALADPRFLARFTSVLTLESAGAYNRVYVLSRVPLPVRTLRARARARLGEDASALSFASRTIHPKPRLG